MSEAQCSDKERPVVIIQGKYDFVFMLQQMCSGRPREEEEEGEADEEKELKEER